MSQRKPIVTFPGDLLSLLLLPAMVIIYAIVPFQLFWLVILLIGGFEGWIGVSALRQRRSSPMGWFTLTMGVGFVAAAAYLFLVPFVTRTI